MGLNAASYAKVNLFLRVLGRRADGFHNIETIIQTISLHDLLAVEAADSGIEVTVTGPARGGVPEGEENLCFKAAGCLFRESVKEPPDLRLDLKGGIRIKLKKMVPAGAGLGGGSSNAACTLMAVNQLFDLGLSLQELCEIGAMVGSDVPALILGGTVLARGRGEQVERVEGIPPLYFLIMKPDFACRTETIYRFWDEVGHAGGEEIGEVVEALRKGDLCALREMELNDLEVPAFSLYPELQGLKTELLGGGAEVALLCGSGSAVMGIFSSQEERDAAWFELRQPGREVFHAESVGQGVTLRA